MVHIGEHVTENDIVRFEDDHERENKKWRPNYAMHRRHVRIGLQVETIEVFVK